MRRMGLVAGWVLSDVQNGAVATTASSIELSPILWSADNIGHPRLAIVNETGNTVFKGKFEYG